MRAKLFLWLFVMATLFTGCHSMHTITHGELEAMYHKGDTQSVMPQILYCGTADGFDYFVVQVLLARDYHCRINSPVGDLQRMPLTKDKAKWVIYDIDKPAREAFMRKLQLEGRGDSNEAPKIIWPEKKQ